jgi:hypothetical protein
MRSRCLGLVAVLATTLASASPAAAATCGTANPKSSVTPKAALEPDPDSVTTIAFKRDTDPQRLLIRFKASGCDLPSHPDAPTIGVLPKANVKNIPDGALSDPTVVADGASYALVFRVDPAKFDPGSYGGFVEVRSRFFATARVPIGLSRSESNEKVPVVLGLVGGSASLLWFLGLRLAKGATTPIKWWHYLFGFAAAAISGVIAVETAYRSQDVWSLGENAGSALAAAFTGATTGAMVAALAVLFPEPKRDDAGRRERSATATGQKAQRGRQTPAQRRAENVRAVGS